MTNCETDIIIIRGAPGVGKTKTAKCLASHYPGGVRIEIDSLRSMVISVEWTNQEEHIGILSLSTDLLRGFLRLGFRPVIVVDTFSGDKLDKYLADLRRLDEKLVVRLFALVTDVDELKRRLEDRLADEFRDVEISQKLNSQVVRYLHPTEELIDTTEAVPEETARQMLETLGGR